jgi:alkylhydroperoxidase/carboxymuconolactone decarboxylase family protein YurZ
MAVAGAVGSEPVAYLHSRTARAFGASADELAEAALVAKGTAGLAAFLRARGENGLRFKAEADAIVGAIAPERAPAA